MSYGTLLYTLLAKAATPNDSRYVMAKHTMVELHKKVTMPRFQKAAKRRHVELLKKFPDFQAAI